MVQSSQSNTKLLSCSSFNFYCPLISNEDPPKPLPTSEKEVLQGFFLKLLWVTTSINGNHICTLFYISFLVSDEIMNINYASTKSTTQISSPSWHLHAFKVRKKIRNKLMDHLDKNSSLALDLYLCLNVYSQSQSRYLRLYGREVGVVRVIKDEKQSKFRDWIRILTSLWETVWHWHRDRRNNVNNVCSIY